MSAANEAAPCGSAELHEEHLYTNKTKSGWLYDARCPGIQDGESTSLRSVDTRCGHCGQPVHLDLAAYAVPASTPHDELADRLADFFTFVKRRRAFVHDRSDHMDVYTAEEVDQYFADVRAIVEGAEGPSAASAALRSLPAAPIVVPGVIDHRPPNEHAPRRSAAPDEPKRCEHASHSWSDGVRYGFNGGPPERCPE